MSIEFLFWNSSAYQCLCWFTRYQRLSSLRFWLIECFPAPVGRPGWRGCCCRYPDRRLVLKFCHFRFVMSQFCKANCLYFRSDYLWRPNWTSCRYIKCNSSSPSQLKEGWRWREQDRWCRSISLCSTTHYYTCSLFFLTGLAYILFYSTFGFLFYCWRHFDCPL